jgi:outer membrane protein TolC
VLAAKAALAQAQARHDRLLAGPHEWIVRGGFQRRSDTTAGSPYAEYDMALERALRWGGKGNADRAQADSELEVGKLALADAWHEAVRTLMRQWFEARREGSLAYVLRAQADLAREQLVVTGRRLRAGDAARLELMMAQNEVERTEAAAHQGQARAELLHKQLAARYGQIVLNPNALQVQAELVGTPEEWQARILDDNHEIELAEMEAQLAQRRADRIQLDRRADPVVGVRAARERGGQDAIIGVYVSMPLSGAARDADHRLALADADFAAQRHADVRQRVEAQARATVSRAWNAQDAWLRLSRASAGAREVGALAMRAYTLGETPLSEALQARRIALESALAAENARWEALEAMALLLVDSHVVLPPKDGH